VTIGQRLNGWGGADIDVECVDIRTPDGAPRDPGAVDLDVACHAERALARGRGVLLHVLDTSKTGLAGPSREAAAKIAALAPERVHVLVDACQLRCPADRLRSDLDRGFMVLITGSKFAGGPPLSGALLLPEAVATGLRSARCRRARRLQRASRLARTLQTTFAREMTTANLGVGCAGRQQLRNRRFASSIGACRRFLDRFEREVRLRAGTTPRVALLRIASTRVATNPSIVPLAVRACWRRVHVGVGGGKGQVALRTAIANAGMQGAAARLRRIMRRRPARPVGPRAVLRVCASAPQINSVAAQVAQGAAFDDAFAPISRDLQALFAKLGDVLSGECA
jgi:hypothetical protein